MKNNFDKILQITKSTLSGYLLSDGNFHIYKNKHKMTYIEIVNLSITTEHLGIGKDN